MDPNGAELAALALSAMDHRGGDSSGIAGITHAGNFELFRESGLAHEIYTPDTIGYVRSLGMVALIGHDRYATSGPADKHQQPVEAGTGNKRVHVAQNGNLSNLDPLRRYLMSKNIDPAPYNDTEMSACAIAEEVERGATPSEAAATIFPLLIGAHCTVVCGKDADGDPELAVMRDAHGVRPLVLGKTKDGYMVTSETIGLDAAGAEFIREVRPGELLTINKNGLESRQLAEPDPKFDLLELIYFSHPDSKFKGVPIREIRKAFGTQLGKEYREVYGREGIDPDTLVIGMPSSGLPYAEGFAAELKLEFRPNAVVKIGRERSFMQPTQIEREKVRGRKYRHNRLIIAGRPVIAADDSIVRGTTTPFATEQIRAAGALSVSWAIGSPAILHPNFYGMDLARQEELIAARLNNDQERIRQEIRCERLAHLSLAGQLKTVEALTGEPASHFETSCFDGVYPIDIGARDIRKFVPHSRQPLTLV